MFLRRTVFICLFAAPTFVAAQDAGNGISFRFGVGPSVGPGYFGDEDYDPSIALKFQLERFQFGGVATGEAATGLGFGGSVRFIGARDPDDFDELTGLEEIDPTLEIGGGLEFTGPNYDVFAKVRYGVVGHESFVAELGGDYVYQPIDQLTVSAGPRVLLGDDDYAQTYFGVSDTESGASGLDQFDASGGLISAGAELEAIYSLNDDWEVVGTINYDQLQADAADSPISFSDDQFSGSIVITRRITLGF